MRSDVDAAHAMLLGPMLSCLLFVLGSDCVYDDCEQKKLAFGSMVPHACALRIVSMSYRLSSMSR